MSEQTNNNIDFSPKQVLTTKKILLHQLLWFPIFSWALIPLLFLTLLGQLFGVELSISGSVFLHVCGMVASCTIAVSFAFKFKYSSVCTVAWQKIAMFLNLPVLLLAAVIGSTFSEAGAIWTLVLLNPVLLPVLGFLLVIDSTIVPSFVILNAVCFDMVFFLLTLRCYKKEKSVPVDATAKPLPKGFLPTYHAAISVLLALCLTFCALFQYPNFEYKTLVKRFEMIEFSEEKDDYNFYQSFPFVEDNVLAKLNSQPTLTFDDISTSPRLDGATAFYPIYSAFVEATYSGLLSYYQNLLAQQEGYVDSYRLFLYTDIYDENPVYDILSCTKTGTAYERLLNKEVDMIFAFEPSVEQLAEAADRGETLVLTPIGYDAFCFFVNVDNPVNGMTTSQIKDVFSGKITNWKEVGGSNQRIFAFTRPNGSGSQTIMENAVMQGAEINLKYQARVVISMGGALMVVDSYINSPAAIGYTFMYYSSSMVVAEKIKYLSIDGVAPSPQNIKNGTYPFSQPFYAVTLQSNTDKNTADLLQWILSEQGQELIAKTGYLSL